MRNVRYYAGTERVNRADYVDARDWVRYGAPGAFPGKAGRLVPVGVNAAGERVVLRAIEFKQHGSRHECDARCLNAKGGSCECSCGGENHGAGSWLLNGVAA